MGKKIRIETTVTFGPKGHILVWTQSLDSFQDNLACHKSGKCPAEEAYPITYQLNVVDQTAPFGGLWHVF